MRYLVIAAHDELACALQDAVKLIAGEQQAKRVHPFCMTMGKEVQTFLCEVQAFLADKEEADEFLILCDLYGASPCNSALMGFRYTNYRIVTGVNLGMVLEALFSLDAGTLDELGDQLVEKGKEGITKVYIASDTGCA